MENIINNISEKINKGVSISPFLFVGNNLEIINKNVYDLALDLSKKYEIPKSYIYTFKDNWEKIKVKDVKNFVENKDSIPPYRFQIFIFENISNFTESSSNSLLKFFEEPWIYNIIFTTNVWENSILDTILSRVQKVNLWWVKQNSENAFFQKMIKEYIYWRNNDIIKYFFSKKAEKEEYIEILENIVIYMKNNIVFINHIEELFEEINLIKKNNLNAKYIFDKWIIKLKQ